MRACLGRRAGDRLQRREEHLASDAPREHGGGEVLDELRRVDGRLNERPAIRLVDRLLAVRDEQHDLSRVRAITVALFGEERAREREAVGDRGLAVRRYRVDSRRDLGRVVRPRHARRRILREGHHREARRVRAEGEHVHQILGEGLQLALHRGAESIRLALHRAALIEHQREVNLIRARGLGRGWRRRRRGRRRRRRGRRRRRRRRRWRRRRRRRGQRGRWR